MSTLPHSATGVAEHKTIYHAAQVNRATAAAYDELHAGQLIAEDIPATHLRWLREELGERFLTGVLLHTGPCVYELDEQIIAAPIAVLWG